MKAEGRNEGGATRTVPFWIKALVALHVFASIVWALPMPPPLVAQGKVQPHATLWLLFWNAKYLKALPEVQAYLMSTGTWQYWDMFAPDPASTDWYCTADVTYRDGTERTIAYPRMFSLTVPEKYVKERYRKFYERAHVGVDGKAEPNTARLFPPFAQTMALRAYTDPNNPPVVVRLKQHYRTVADPGQPQTKAYTDYEYYDYAVDQRRLRQEAAGR